MEHNTAFARSEDVLVNLGNLCDRYSEASARKQLPSRDMKHSVNRTQHYMIMMKLLRNIMVLLRMDVAGQNLILLKKKDVMTF